MMVLTNLNPEELKQQLTDCGYPPYRTDQLLNWVYRKGTFQSAFMTNIPESLRQWIHDSGGIIPLQESTRLQSSDGTEKHAFRLRDGQLVESVSIPMETGKRTFCISSQVGCAMGCHFCATATLGFKRNLEPGEMVSQVLLLKQAAGLTDKQAFNVVFMGMGEPLMNTETC